MSWRQGRWWAIYEVREVVVLVDVHGEYQQIRARTFHLPSDPRFPAWKAESVITIDDVAVSATGATEDDALRELRDEARKAWEARIEAQRRGSPTLPEPSGDVYFNKPWLSIHWDPKRSYVHAEFKGFATSAEFRAGSMKIIEAIRGRSATALVSDNRRLEGLGDRDQQWLSETWVPEAVSAGLRRIAVVLPHHGLAKVASEEIIRGFEAGRFVTRTFTTVSEAVEWVVDSENQPEEAQAFDS
jgi:hypothetical protein